MVESTELLYRELNKRPPPLRDEKILASWNGLMISAHAQAGLILGDPHYTDRAVTAARFLLDTLYADGRLSRSYTDGQAKHNAYLDDYAFLTAGLLDLYEATGDSQWMQKAIELDRVLATFYEDKKNGGFFMTSSDHEKLLAREKPRYDGAEPSGNSIAILNLYRLHAFTTEESYRKRADQALQTFSRRLQSNPTSLSDMLLALDFRLDKPKEIVIVTPSGKKGDAGLFLAEFRKKYLPNRILVVSEEGEALALNAEVVPVIKSKLAQNGKTTAYVCEKGLCKLPTGDPITFSKQISAVEKLED
ncbi:thioredoxin domain-containing protein [Candidatus Uhrbacteria bacterium]|nr:thioredoxin domain-containing protein [Candidatus Uhrbacteria bacterium]